MKQPLQQNLVLPSPQRDSKTSSRRFLFYTTSFGGTTNQWLLASLLVSINHNLKGTPLFDVIVVTDDEGARVLRELLPTMSLSIEVIVASAPNQRYGPTWVRYMIHALADLTPYTHVLYLDPDIWVASDLNSFFVKVARQATKRQPLLAFKDSNTDPKALNSDVGLEFYGGLIFEQKGMLERFASCHGFTTGILFFANTPRIEALFKDAPIAFKRFRRSNDGLKKFYKCDQPYVNFLAISRGLVNLGPLDSLVWNNPSGQDAGKATFFHFCGRIGNPDKPDKIATFVHELPTQPAEWAKLLKKLLVHEPQQGDGFPQTAVFQGSVSPPQNRDNATNQGNAARTDSNLPPINRQIPGQMTDRELERLMLLASQVPPGGVIVEIGCLYGLSTWHISKAARPGVTIFCLDPWQRTPWIVRLVEKPQNAPPFGRQAFERFTRDCNNIVMIQGFSPEVAKGWNLPVDMCFEDAVHENPILCENLSFWAGKLKAGSTMCGHDYSTQWPDVVSAADRLANSFCSQLTVVDTLWSVTKSKAVTGNS